MMWWFIVPNTSLFTDLNHNSLHVSSMYITHSTILQVQQLLIF